MLKIILEYKETYSTEIFIKEDIGYYSFLDAKKWPYSINYIIREYTNYIDKTELDSLDIFSDNKHLHINYKGYKLDVLQCLVKEDSFINYLTDTNFIPEKKLHNVVRQFIQYIDQEEKKDMKITFTFGDTVKTILNQDNDGYYIYTPDNNLILPIKFFSIKDAIAFFSNFLPTKVYDEDKNSLNFLFTLEYESKTINFYMKDEDRTKIAWTDYNSDIKGFNDFWSKNREVDDSIDDVTWYFIKWVKTTPKKESSHLTLTYYCFTSKVYWDSNKGWWYVSHIFNKADKDILKEDAIIGKDIQELQAKFEEYIDKHLKEKTND